MEDTPQKTWEDCKNINDGDTNYTYGVYIGGGTTTLRCQLFASPHENSHPSPIR